MTDIRRFRTKNQNKINYDLERYALRIHGLVNEEDKGVDDSESDDDNSEFEHFKPPPVQISRYNTTVISAPPISPKINKTANPVNPRKGIKETNKHKVTTKHSWVDCNPYNVLVLSAEENFPENAQFEDTFTENGAGIENVHNFGGDSLKTNNPLEYSQIEVDVNRNDANFEESKSVFKEEKQLAATEASYEPYYDSCNHALEKRSFGKVENITQASDIAEALNSIRLYPDYYQLISPYYKHHLKEEQYDKLPQPQLHQIEKIEEACNDASKTSSIVPANENGDCSSTLNLKEYLNINPELLCLGIGYLLVYWYNHCR